MKKRLKNPDYPVVNPHISGAVAFDDGWVFISGQGPIDMPTKAVVRGTIEEETRRTLENIDTMLREAGCERADVVKCTCYLDDLAEFPGFNKVYEEFYTQEVPPARTTLQAKLLQGIKVEIDAIARRRSKV